jgi:hypothetical protein
MIILFQYTLTDIRKFTSAENLLITPDWPQPKPYKEFVRGSGQVVPKTDTELATYLGRTCITENFVCKINKGIKIPRYVTLEGLRFHNKVNYYYSDGGILAKYEFMFETKLEKPLAYATFEKLLYAFLELRVNIRNTGFKHSEYQFKYITKGLKELQIATTTRKQFLHEANQEKYILECMPQVFVTLGKNEFIYPKAESKLAISLKDEASSTLCAWWERYKANPYKIWLLNNKGKTDNPFIRSIRSGILRIHSEKECINNVTQSVLSGFLNVEPRSQGANTLQNFLNEKIKNVDTRFKKIQDIDDSQKLEAFIKQAYNQFNPGEITDLHDKIKRLELRPQFEKKLVTHIIKNAVNIEKIEYMENKQEQNFGSQNTFHGDIHQTMNVHAISEDQYKNYYEQLDTVLAKLRDEPVSYDQKVAVTNLEKAQDAIINKEPNKFIDFLKKAGTWAADFAKSVGVEFITELMKSKLEK